MVYATHVAMDHPLTRSCVLAALIVMIRPMVSGPIEEYAPVSTLEAIDHLYSSLPQQMLLEEKCKRYAVVLLVIGSKGRINQLKLSELLTLDTTELDRICYNVKPENLSALFMNAIDGYRVTELRPTFLELVKCLELIDTPYVEKFLASDELKLIIHLYKEVTLSPHIQIDLDQYGLDSYHPAFRTSLNNLFSKYLSSGGTSRSVVNKKRKNPRAATAVQRELEQMTEEQRKQIRREWHRDRQSKHRLEKEKLEKHREQERLRQQRIRLLYPEKQREKEKMKSKLRRDREREKRLLKKQQQQDDKEQRQQPVHRRLRLDFHRERRKLQLQEQQHELRPQDIVRPDDASMPETLPSIVLPQDLDTEQMLPGTPSSQPKRQRLFDSPRLSAEQLQAIQMRSLQRPPQPLVRPMTPFPRLSQQWDYREPSVSSPFPMSPSATSGIPSPVGIPFEDWAEHRYGPYVYPIDEHTQPFDTSMSNPVLLDNLNHGLGTWRNDEFSFDDTESILQAFPEPSGQRSQDAIARGEGHSTREPGQQKSTRDD